MKKLATLVAVFATLIPFAASAQAVACSCVLALRELQGVNIHGDAWTIRPNVPLSDVQVGDVVLLNYNVGHAALATAVETRGEAMPDGSYHTRPVSIQLWEANYSSCKITTRTISVDDIHLRGIYRPVDK